MESANGEWKPYEPDMKVITEGPKVVKGLFDDIFADLPK